MSASINEPRARPIQLRGWIVFASPTRVAPPAKLRLRLIEVAAADAPSRDVFEAEIQTQSPGTVTRLPFDVLVSLPDSTHDYYLLASFHHTGGREIVPGDQMTTAACPVNPGAASRDIELSLNTV